METAPKPLLALPILVGALIVYAAGVGVLVLQYQLQGILAAVVATVIAIGLAVRWAA